MGTSDKGNKGLRKIGGLVTTFILGLLAVNPFGGGGSGLSAPDRPVPSPVMPTPQSRYDVYMATNVAYSAAATGTGPDPLTFERFHAHLLGLPSATAPHGKATDLYAAGQLIKRFWDQVDNIIDSIDGLVDPPKYMFPTPSAAEMMSIAYVPVPKKLYGYFIALFTHESGEADGNQERTAVFARVTCEDLPNTSGERMVQLTFQDVLICNEVEAGAFPGINMTFLGSLMDDGAELLLSTGYDSLGISRPLRLELFGQRSRNLPLHFSSRSQFYGGQAHLKCLLTLTDQPFGDSGWARYADITAQAVREASDRIPEELARLGIVHG